MLPSRLFFDDFFNDETPRHEGFMKCDIYEEDNKTLIEMDMPGAKKEDLSLDIEDGYLTVTYTKEANENENRKYIRHERKQITTAQRRFYVGSIDENSISAEFKDGILTIKVPTEEKEPAKKSIKID